MAELVLEDVRMVTVGIQPLNWYRVWGWTFTVWIQRTSFGVDEWIAMLRSPE